MHSSRIRTGCSLTVYRGVPPYGGGSPSGGLLGRGVPPSGDGGGGPFLGGLLGRGSPSQGVSFWGVSLVGGLLGRGVSLAGGGIPACTEADPPPVNRMTDRCKNITLATTSLRPVKI